MFKKIMAGYGAILLSVLRFLLLLAVCVGTGFIIVYPLWKVATLSPSLYSLIFIVLLILITAFIAVIKIRASLRHDKRRFFLSVARKLTLAAGIGFSVFLIYNYQRALSGIVLLVTIILYGFLAFGLQPDKKTGENPPTSP